MESVGVQDCQGHSLSREKGVRAAIHVLSCYAPTFAATRDLKEAFYDDLQSAIDEIPSGEKYIILGDFNAHVGSRRTKNEQWCKVRGPFGLGEENDAGSELLNFLLLNEATICNTWFKKKAIHKQIWQHPKSKKWHCIDYAITRQGDRKWYLDVEVKRGAECHTDHQLL